MAAPSLLLLTTLLATACLLHHGYCARCGAYLPSVEQKQVGYGEPPTFWVQVTNKCPMCPVINIHVKCGEFPQSLVSPKLFKVLSYNDCVVNGGLPLQPLQLVTFNYSHHKFPLSTRSWFFQCE